MNKSVPFPFFFRLIPATIFFSILLSGCGEVRHDNTTRIYTVGKDTPTVSNSVTRYTISPEDNATASYSLDKDEGATTYTARESGNKYTIGQDDTATAHYSRDPDEGATTSTAKEIGVRYTIGQYDKATAHYTLRAGGRSDSETIRPQRQVKTHQKTDELASELPMVLEITDVLFEFDKWVIKEKFYPELEKWVQFFENHPQVKAKVYGHADSTGPTLYNQKLSEKRAQAVIDYLIGKGVDPGRLTAVGFGESLPVAPNTTPEGRQKNRRVELDY